VVAPTTMPAGVPYRLVGDAAGACWTLEHRPWFTVQHS